MRRKSKTAAGIAAAQAAAGGYGSDEEVHSTHSHPGSRWLSPCYISKPVQCWCFPHVLQRLVSCTQVYQTASAVDAAAKAQAPEYDSDDNLVVPDKLNKTVEPLKPLDHDQIEYEEFTKDFYEPAADIAALTDGQVEVHVLPAVVILTMTTVQVLFPPTHTVDKQVHERRRQLGVRLSGFDAPSPVTTFQQCGLDSALLAAIRKSGFTAPTPIQAQALPAVLSGRDVLVRSPHAPRVCIDLSWSSTLPASPLRSCSQSGDVCVHADAPGHCADRIGQDCRLCAADVGAHHGSAGAEEGRGPHRRHSCTHPVRFDTKNACLCLQRRTSPGKQHAFEKLQRGAALHVSRPALSSFHTGSLQSRSTQRPAALARHTTCACALRLAA